MIPAIEYCIKCGMAAYVTGNTFFHTLCGPICSECASKIEPPKVGDHPGKILPMVEGCDTARKSEPLLNRIQAVINEEEFGNMTICEIIGVLEIAKATHLQRMFQE